ncbi:hypothetical protein [Enterococcus entomosocium]|uniref:hypothetical protein n=1 Tax=Enterococcus entomosocium TaxID=3034352 RepID=UPI0026487FA6|nr:hypothetical protein [Enterococcus entomosocium]
MDKKEEYLKKFQRQQNLNDFGFNEEIAEIGKDIVILLKKRDLTYEEAYASLQFAYNDLKYKSNFISINEEDGESLVSKNEKPNDEEKVIADVFKSIDKTDAIGSIDFDPSKVAGILKGNESKEKVEITLNSQVDTFEKAKELLADLEVLNKKYDVVATVTVCPQLNHGVLGDKEQPKFVGGLTIAGKPV